MLSTSSVSLIYFFYLLAGVDKGDGGVHALGIFLLSRDYSWVPPLVTGGGGAIFGGRVWYTRHCLLRCQCNLICLWSRYCVGIVVRGYLNMKARGFVA